MASIIVMTGGGIKAAAAASRNADASELVFLHVDYGQRSAAIEFEMVNLLAGSFPTARALSVEMPQMHQLRVSSSDGPAPTVPSGQRMFMRAVGDFSPAALRGLFPALLSAGVQAALDVGASTVVTGVSRMVDAAHLGLPLPAGDRGRHREFVHAFNIMLEELLPATATVQVEAPLVDAPYADIIRLASHFRVPFDKTWSCMLAGPQPCDRCAVCKARAAAFLEARLPDSTLAQAPA